MLDELFTEEELKVHEHERHHHEHHHDEDGHCCGHEHDDEHGHEHEHHHHDEDSHEHHHHDEDNHGHEHHHHDDGEECCCGHDHHHGHEGHHHADDVFTSWGVETPHKFNEEELKEILEKLADTEEYGIILRAKGIVPGIEGEWLHFDLVPGEYEVRKGASDYTGRICVIGTDLKEEQLKELFNI